MEGTKDRRHMIIFGGTANEAGGTVLNSLKSVNEILWTASKKGIAIVKPRKNESRNESGSCLRD